MSKSIFWLIALISIFAATAYADEQAEYKKSIDNIAQQINTISRNINANKKALKTEQDKLFEAEKALDKLGKSIAETNQSIKDQQQKFDQLSLQLEGAQKQKVVNQQALSKLIESRYKNSDPDYLKRLLNQENPYAVGRLNNYHQYFSQALQNKISETQQQLQEVEKLQVEYQAALNNLEEKKRDQIEQQESLNKTKKARSKSIEKLNKKVATSSEQVERLRNDRNRLNNLLKQIEKQKEELKRLEQEQLKKQQQDNAPRKTVIRPLVKGGFIKQKGRLQYPVDGKHLRKFGSRLAESGMTSEGLFIETTNQRAVKSIFRGRVIFSEFLKGYGLLLIVDHGDDHISLYGHNSVLYKKVGDTVETNEIIAETGVTGGLKTAGLYFEIRQNATPVNPSTWCQ